MPNCFQLISKTTKETIALQTVDNELCAFLKVEPDPKLYVRGWVDSIGFRIAVGTKLGKEMAAKLAEARRHSVKMMRRWPQETEDQKKICLEEIADLHRLYDTLDDINEWLDEHYTSDAWAEIGRR